MSREAWGDPPEPEPQRCPNCGATHHTEGCEVCDLDVQRIKAEGEAMRLRAALSGMVTLLETLRTDGKSRYCYVESRSGSMVQVADAIDSARAALGPNVEAERTRPAQQE